jgi:hypothetical protein
MVPEQERLGTGLRMCDVLGQPRVLVFEEEAVGFCHPWASRAVSEEDLSHLLCRALKTDYG